MKTLKFNTVWRVWTRFLPIICITIFSCSDDPQSEILESPAIAPLASFSIPNVIFAGEVFNLTNESTDSDGTVTSYVWDFGDTNSSIEENPSHMYVNEGSYAISLTVTDNDDLTNTTTTVINVEASTNNETGSFDRTIMHDGNTREYAIYIPTTYDETVETSLLVYLHGAPEDKTIAQATTSFTSISEANGFIVVYPEAFFEDVDNGGYVWADGRNGVADQAGIDDLGFINELISSLETEFNINPNKIYASGFSNGGFFTQHLAQQPNSKFSAFASVAASLHESYANSMPSSTSMLYMFGTVDPFLSYTNGGTTPGNFQFEDALDIESAVDYWVTINNCNPVPIETEISDANTADNSTITTFEYTGGDNGVVVKFYRINGGGHTWPGVNARPPFFGGTNLDIDASEEIWNFLNQF